ncbi:endonuclease/exonuclease/phosphatase family protein [Octadecabacter ascidiaceicola]|uniref:Endonuclease/Exonuclease/phosphatase family protein n=1 Tax=Octadecabacter ascidiaceicola TaxID=1655543 RepID=A0A238JR75_9RHOB|nr:endonuclease/exonuclease/phosphatase family protein [Octadecabacter ascidiaceicola]SMX32246.1 Endonuclease/Exonuclease/phosphatase family protein [Octadecabacter ascidiaceicola]
MLKVLGRVLVVMAALVLAASFAGDLHGVGDSLAVFRLAILVGAFVVAALVWRWRGAQVLAIASLGIGGLQLADGALARVPDAPDFVLYQKNLLYLERDRTEFIADVFASGADAVTLQEVGPANEKVLEALRAEYPHQLLCNARGMRRMAIVSRTPFEVQECFESSGAARVVTQVGGRSVQVYSLHLYWPYPYPQARQVAGFTPIFEAQDAAFTVVGGDFNMAPWGRSVAAIEAATGTERVGRPVATYYLYGYPLAIDHVLATGGMGSLEARAKMGSDHLGLVASIVFP